MSENKYKIEFAPLQGYTEFVYRNAHHQVFGGIDTYYTPFVRLEKGDSFRTRELRDIDPENNNVNKLIPQLIASNPEELKRITDLFLSKGYNKADINMGCPFPLLVRRAKGAGILQHPDLVEQILKTISEIKDMEFSVKMRLGWDSVNDSENLINMLNDSDISQISLHARLGIQQYKGDINKEAFAHFYSKCNKPLLFNGDIKTVEDINNIVTEFPKLKGVMIGRGLLANPALAKEFKSGEIMSSEMKKTNMKKLHEAVFQEYSSYLQGEKQILEKMKPFWEYLKDELEKKTRKKIEKANKLSVYESAVSLAFSQWGKVDKDTEE